MVGKLNGKVTKRCEICGQKHVRTISVSVESRKESDIEKAKAEYARRVGVPYTCRICKSISESVKAGRK